jgi:hypothetical protein
LIDVTLSFLEDVLHYRILRKLGAGGMGEVYLADDTKLRLKVAIKFMQPTAATGDQAGRSSIGFDRIPGSRRSRNGSG